MYTDDCIMYYARHNNASALLRHCALLGRDIINNYLVSGACRDVAVLESESGESDESDESCTRVQAKVKKRLVD